MNKGENVKLSPGVCYILLYFMHKINTEYLFFFILQYFVLWVLYSDARLNIYERHWIINQLSQ